MEGNISGDAFQYCKVCRRNHSQGGKHRFAKKHKMKLRDILQKYGQKIKECRAYLNDPVIQEGDFEANSSFWCHCCNEAYSKHVTDFLKTIVYGGVIEHLACEEHWVNTENFWKEHGADPKFKTSFIVSQTDLLLFKSKLEPLVDVFDSRKQKHTAVIAKQIETQENSRKLLTGVIREEEESSKMVAPLLNKTIKNHWGVLQNPTGYYDNVRVWRGGIVKCKPGSDQIRPFSFPCQGEQQENHNERFIHKTHTVTAQSETGLTAVRTKFDESKGNIHTGAMPPWLCQGENPAGEFKGNLVRKQRLYGPSEEDLKNYLKSKEKSKLNPNRVGANFDHSVNNTQDTTNWLPSFGRVWNHSARWKSRHQYRSEVATSSQSKRK